MTWLVEHKAKADVSDNLGRTPADLAMIRGNEAGAMAASRHESAGESAGKGTVLESQLGTGKCYSATIRVSLFLESLSLPHAFINKTISFCRTTTFCDRYVSSLRSI